MIGRHGSVVGGGGDGDSGGGGNTTRALKPQLGVTGRQALGDATASRLSIAVGDQCRSGGSSTEASRSGGGDGGDGSLRLARRQVSTGLRASTTGSAGRRYAQHGIRRRGRMTARIWCFDASPSHWTRARGCVGFAAAAELEAGVEKERRQMARMGSLELCSCSCSCRPKSNNRRRRTQRDGMGA